MTRWFVTARRHRRLKRYAEAGWDAAASWFAQCEAQRARADAAEAKLRAMNGEMVG